MGAYNSCSCKRAQDCCQGEADCRDARTRPMADLEYADESDDENLLISRKGTRANSGLRTGLEATSALRAQMKSLAQALKKGDIRLVRAEYLYTLKAGKLPFPRRQEAEPEYCICKGKQESALVTHEEVADWSEGRKPAVICSISHCWESRFHPDPCGYQLEKIVDCISLYDAAYDDDIWVFYDYVSVLHFPNTWNNSKGYMHKLFSHECSLTLIVEGLTPETVWQAKRHVPIYDQLTGQVERVNMNNLKQNRIPYFERGWCRAEVEWSIMRGRPAQHQWVDSHACSRYRVPMTPESFKTWMADAKFKDEADKELLTHLHKQIYKAKFVHSQEAVFEHVPASEVSKLAAELTKVKQLRALRIRKVEVGEKEAQELGEALVSLEALEEVEIRLAGDSDGTAMAKALSDVLKHTASITQIDFASKDISDAGVKSLLEVLKHNATVTKICLTRAEDAFGLCAVRPEAPLKKLPPKAEEEGGFKRNEALAEAFKHTCAITCIDLSGDSMGDSGAEALADALRQNSAITHIDLRGNSIGDSGAKALAEALKQNSTVTYINLRDSSIGDTGCKALADALTHATIRITAILLDMNCIGDDGAKARACQTLRTANATTWLQTGTLLLELCNQALAAASAHNTTITMISLGYNRIGAAGIQAWVFQMFRSCRAALSWTSCQALADALRQNSAITHIDLRGNSIGDSGAKALAEALKQNSTVTYINLRDSSIGDTGCKARGFEVFRLHLAVQWPWC
ncbi:NLRC3 [Symbiodinium natans]|uniref:NLRC3 protein n=1 Tax=Symbiodinium natans TaxID=878477 RepID=A0A812J846_9DINO|nr:NLRC3 [Symbiodinium natans]